MIHNYISKLKRFNRFISPPCSSSGIDSLYSITKPNNTASYRPYQTDIRNTLRRESGRRDYCSASSLQNLISPHFRYKILFLRICYKILFLRQNLIQPHLHNKISFLRIFITKSYSSAYSLQNHNPPHLHNKILFLRIFVTISMDCKR